MSFGAGFAQGLQPGIAYLTKKNADEAEEKRFNKREEAADKRFNERLVEQRAYGVMQETKKEARRLGATEEELATYNGEENQHALELRMDELREQNKAGTAAFRAGTPLYLPDTETGTGEGTIKPSAGFERGYANEEATAAEQKFKDKTQAQARANERDAYDAEESQKIIDSLSRKYPGADFDARAPLAVLREQQANFNAGEAMNKRAALLGIPQPVPSGLSPVSPDIEAAIGRSEVQQYALDTAMARSTAEKLVGEQAIQNKQKESDENTRKEFLAKFPNNEAEATPAQMSVMLEQLKNKNEDYRKMQSTIINRDIAADNAFRDMASGVNFPIVDDEKGMASRASKDHFHRLYEKKRVYEKMFGQNGEPIIDSAGDQKYFSIEKYVPRGKPNPNPAEKKEATTPPATTHGKPMPGFGPGVRVRQLMPTGE